MFKKRKETLLLLLMFAVVKSTEMQLFKTVIVLVAILNK